MTVNFLKKTLGECKRADSICENSTSYETVSLTEFFVIDGASGHPVRISKDENDNHLTVTNSKSSTLTLIKVDSCLIHGNKEKKCDCILFNNKKIFFIELSEREGSSRKEKRNEAIKQLENTLDIFKRNKVKFNHLESTAIICFWSISRTILTSMGEKKVAFKRKHNMYLKEERIIRF